MFINGQAHGPGRGITTCQLHMRRFRTGTPSTSSPGVRRPSRDPRTRWWTAAPFDRIQAAGGFISVNTSGNLVDGNATPIPKDDADEAFDAATCIRLRRLRGHLYQRQRHAVRGRQKVSQFALLPQGRPEAKTPRAEHGGADRRTWSMVATPGPS